MRLLKSMKCPNCLGVVDSNGNDTIRCSYCESVLYWDSDEKHIMDNKALDSKNVLIEDKRNTSVREKSDVAKKYAQQEAVKHLVFVLLVVLVEVAFYVVMTQIDINKTVNESLQGYLKVNLLILLNALVVGVLCWIGKSKFGIVLGIIVCVVYAILILLAAREQMAHGIIVAVFGVVFFGGIEFGVAWLSWFLLLGFGRLSEED